MKKIIRRITNKLVNRQAGIVLETALIIPVILSLCFFMLSATLTLQQEIVMRYALDHTAQELAVLFPLADAFYQEQIKSYADDLFQSLEIMSDDLKDISADLASSVFLQNFMQNKVEKWMRIGADHLGIKIQAHQRQIILSTFNDYALKIEMNYFIKTPWNQKERTIYTYLPLWTKYDTKFQPETSDEQEQADDQIWQEHNFVRGKYFREKYGANLPFNYPVISGFENGQVISVRSIDTTAPLYQNPEQLKRQIEIEIEQLRDFQGCERETLIEPNVIKAEQIKSKQLLLVIPQNGTDEAKQKLFQDLESYAAMNQIQLKIETSGNSYRYIEKTDE